MKALLCIQIWGQGAEVLVQAQQSDNKSMSMSWCSELSVEVCPQTSSLPLGSRIVLQVQTNQASDGGPACQEWHPCGELGGGIRALLCVCWCVSLCVCHFGD